MNSIHVTSKNNATKPFMYMLSILVNCKISCFDLSKVLMRRGATSAYETAITVFVINSVDLKSSGKREKEPMQLRI